MHEVNSVSLFVGTNECNAYCAHCAGTPLRRYAPKTDGVVDEPLIRTTLDDVYERGARYVSLSSSGEPTLSPLAVTKTLAILDQYAQKGKRFTPINLYTNGIRIGDDKNFCDAFLPVWKDLGLTTLYVTVHDIDMERNAYVYGVDHYPSLERIVEEIREHEFLSRANIVLSKQTIGTFEDFVVAATHLFHVGFNSISAWPVRDSFDEVHEHNAPSDEVLDGIESWIEASEYPIRLLREDSKQAYTSGKKLTLFPNGVLSNTWCR